MLSFAVQDGQSDGVDLVGRRVIVLIDLPGDFLSGNGTARLYLDDGANPEQRRELEAIFTGKKGGPGAVLGSLVTTWLPMQSVSILANDKGVAVGSAGALQLQPIVD